MSKRRWVIVGVVGVAVVVGVVGAAAHEVTERRTRLNASAREKGGS